MPSLYSKFRPTTFAEVVGQDEALARLEVLREHCGWEGQVLWLVGESGVGKTTIARIIAASVGNDFVTEEVDAQDVSIETVREWERKCQFRPLDGKGWVFICNEAHGLSSKVVSRLQTILEDSHVERNSTWIFTTTNRGERRLFDSKFDACPFLSRAISIRLRPHGEFGGNAGAGLPVGDDSPDDDTYIAFAKRVHEIATAENLNGQPLERYIELAVECRCNFRLMLQRVAAGEMLI